MIAALLQAIGHDEYRGRWIAAEMPAAFDWASLAWPLVAALAVVLAFIVAMRAVQGRHAHWATKAEVKSAQASFNAAQIEIGSAVTSLAERLEKLEAHQSVAGQMERAKPLGLRRGGG